VTSTEQRIGPWVVRYEWDPEVSHLSPSRVVIEPAPDAPRETLIKGISSSVTREMRPVRPKGGLTVLREVMDHLKSLQDHRPGNPVYLAALAAAYSAATASLNAEPVKWLAKSLDRSPNTIKAHVAAARREGMLTSVSSHLPGGELTGKARALLVGL
jgi:hypothetical protein